MRSVTPGLLRRVGFRRGMLVNGVLSSLGYAVCALFRPDWPFALMFGLLFCCGAFMSFQFAAYNTVAYEAVPTERMSAASSLYTTLQQLMLSVGICSGALMLKLGMGVGRHREPQHAGFLDRLRRGEPDLAQLDPLAPALCARCRARIERASPPRNAWLTRAGHGPAWLPRQALPNDAPSGLCARQHMRMQQVVQADAPEQLGTDPVGHAVDDLAAVPRRIDVHAERPLAECAYRPPRRSPWRPRRHPHRPAPAPPVPAGSVPKASRRDRCRRVRPARNRQACRHGRSDGCLW